MGWNVVIVGLGKIGMLYDWHLPATTHILTHARAFSCHQDFRLVAAVDPLPGLRSDFEEIFNAPAYKSVVDIPAEVKADVLVVAGPTQLHNSIIETFLAKQSPNTILCEKPLAYNIDEARAIEERCKLASIPLYVNFIRRADPGVLEVRSRLASGQIVMPFKAIVWYSKGLLHNGIHFIDLLSFWFGPILDLKIINHGRRIGGQDAEPDLRLEFDRGSALLCAAREEDYSHFTIEIISANGRLRYERGGEIVWQSAVKKPVSFDQMILDEASEVIPNDMKRYQYHIVEQLSLALKGRKHTLCTGAWSIACQDWLNKAIRE